MQSSDSFSESSQELSTARSMEREMESSKQSSSLKSIKKEPEKVPHQYSIAFESGTYTVKMHQTYSLQPDHSLYKDITSLFAMFVQKEERRNATQYQKVSFSNFPTFQFQLKGEEPADTKCSICQFQFQSRESEQQLVHQSNEDILMLDCSHLIHRGCFRLLRGDNEWIKCPVCSTIFGVMVGDQPPGSMTTRITDEDCDGYADMGTIVIEYSMAAGKRGLNSFPGTHRVAYLPNTDEGREVLQLLKTAFQRKLIFTVGRSVTTGKDNRIIWNGIHHKTALTGGSAYFGFPDQTYFKRLRLQLAAKGIK